MSAGGSVRTNTFRTVYRQVITLAAAAAGVVAARQPWTAAEVGAAALRTQEVHVSSFTSATRERNAPERVGGGGGAGRSGGTLLSDRSRGGCGGGGGGMFADMDALRCGGGGGGAGALMPAPGGAGGGGGGARATGGTGGGTA
jgi:hypothetical protein